jgi:regulator of protease activity HflC (stomatin/prohibitin superfamily)
MFKRELEAGEAAVIVRARGRPPLLVEGPGSVRTFWRWRQTIFVDLKSLTLRITVEDVETKDGVHLAARGIVDAQVVNPVDAAIRVVDYSRATSQVGETALRALFRRRLSEDLRDRTAEVEAALLDEVKSAAASWGVAVSAVHIQLDI